MSLRAPAEVWTCDDGCGKTVVKDYAPHSMPLLPEGWWQVKSHRANTAPFTFCSGRCMRHTINASGVFDDGGDR